MAVMEIQKPPDALARLIGVVQSHEIAEMDAIAVYGDLACRASDPVIGGLLRVLLQDEEHHHRILRAIGMDLRAVASGAAHHTPRPRDAATADSVDLLRAFARQEGDGAEELRRLANQAPDLLGGLFSLLLQVMAMDSVKHQKILTFIAHELPGQDDGPEGPAGAATPLDSR